MFLSLAADIWLAVRRLRAQPGPALIAIATLGLAVGAATAIFSVANTVLLRPLPYPESDRLVRLVEQTTAPGLHRVSLAAVDIWAAEAASLESVFFYEPRSALVMVAGEPDRLRGAMVSRGFLNVMRTEPALGRGFQPGPAIGPPDEVLISHALWQRLGGDDTVIGRSLEIDPRVYTIAGVMPAGFGYPEDAEFWASPDISLEKVRPIRDMRFFRAVGRLRAEATLETLDTELAVLTARHPARDDRSGDIRMTATGLHAELTGQVRPGILIAGAAVGILLIIACANLAALQLAQASARWRESAVQAALGASAARLVRERLAEVLLLAVPAGLLGLLAAWICRDAIIALSADEIPRIDSLAIDGRVFGFALAATLGAALLASLLPARFVARADPAAGLQSGGRGGGRSRGVTRALRALVVAEVALTFVVAAAGVLLARSYERLMSVDRGFSSEGVVAMRLNLPITGKPTRDAQLAFYEDVITEVRARPGVSGAGYVSRLPLGQALASVEVSTVGSGAPAVRSTFHNAGPGYFSTIGTTIVEGREFVDADRTTPAVVINELLARHLFPDGGAVGRRVTFRHMFGPIDAEVVGVSRAVRYNDLTADTLPELYLDYRVQSTLLHLVARTSEGAAAIPVIREIIGRVDSTNRVTVDQVTTLDREVARRLARPAFFLALTGTFAVVAIALAAAGLYGVMAFVVAARRHDIGVRLALGASPRRIARDVVGSGALLTAGGLVLGAGFAVVSTRATESLLFGVTPGDPVTYAVAAALLTIVSLAACVVPAVRARRVDPLEVLRADG
jgi:putative ABC transport system permease protein